MKKRSRCVPDPGKMFLSAFLFLTVFFVSPACSNAAEGSVSQACLGEVCFDKERTVEGGQISLRGLALMEYLRFDLYTSALYVPEGARSIAEVLDGSIPKVLVLHYHRKIRRDQIIKGGDHNLRKNPDVDMGTLLERLDQINAAYQDVTRGDRYELVYEPGKGTSLYFNGSLKVTLPGEDFQKAYLGIWLSEYPIHKKFRDLLLTGTPAVQKGNA